MRNLTRAAVALVILVAAYWSWALVGAAQLASVAAKGDPEAVMQRVDLPALTGSLAGQIARAYLEQNPQFQKMLSLERQFVESVGSGAAEALLRDILTPKNIAALLSSGRGGLPKGGGPNAETNWRMPPLSEAFRAGPWQALMSSHFDGPLSFVVDLESPEGRYGVHLRLAGDDLAPVGHRHPRGSQRPARARDRAEGRRVDRAERGVTQRRRASKNGAEGPDRLRPIGLRLATERTHRSRGKSRQNRGG